MPSRARAIHGISDADLADEPPARDVLPGFLEFLGDPETTTVLAHNAWFDAGFLGSELERVGWTSPGHAIVDTLALARRKLPGLSNHRLDTLARVLDLDPEGPHRALADSLRVKGLWLALRGQDEPIAALVAYPFFAADRPAVAPLGWDVIARAISSGGRVRIEYTGGTRGPAPREVTPRKFDRRGGGRLSGRLLPSRRAGEVRSGSIVSAGMNWFRDGKSFVRRESRSWQACW